jgi:hypothetical protein
LNAQTSFEKGLLLVAPLLVLIPWIWLAVRTSHSLHVVTGHNIPLSKRTIWLVKTLALIVACGGIGGVITQIEIPWLFAVLPAALIIFFALKEKVQAVVPPRPKQDATAYRSAWQAYRHLRTDFIRSWRWLGYSSLPLILVVVFADRIPRNILVGLFALLMVVALASMGVMTTKQLKWLRWPCPRCGCAFRGFWAWLWLPRKCAYCGLPRDDSATLRRASA